MSSPSNPLPRVAARIDELPVFPGVAVRVLSIVRNPDHSLAEVAECVQSDPSIAIRVLALANSALFAPTRPIRTLTHAALFIGERSLTGAIVAASVERFFGASHRGADVPETALWRHSLAVGAMAREIANRCGLDGEHALILGMLHDVGLLHMRTESHTLHTDLESAKAGGLARRKAEAAIFGADHTLLGGALLAGFGIPADLANAITSHHEPPEEGAASEEDCLHVADALAGQAGLSPDEELPPDPPSPAVLRRLALGTHDCMEIVEHASRSLVQLERSLGL